MEGNEAKRLGGPPNFSTLTQHRSYLSPTHNSTLNNETTEGLMRYRDRILTHVDSSEVLHRIPLCCSRLHLSNNTNSPNTSSNGNNNNNADEAIALLEDRKKKRTMFSNRESARRSRMRKKQQIEYLQCHLDHLQTLNRQLSEKIIYLLECNQQILQLNAQLKDKVSYLQVAISELFGPLGYVDQSNNFPTGLIPELSSASTFHQWLASSGA